MDQRQRQPQLGSGWVQVLPRLIYLDETVDLDKFMVKQTLEKLIHDYRQLTVSHSFLRHLEKFQISPLS
jgi:hypothetical protein